ncbi:MAG: septum formation protein [Kiritimatiellia bacterium]|jgi:septum formation protein
MISLASGSPRRAQLLRWVGMSVTVHPQDVDESRQAGMDPVEHAERLAKTKAISARSAGVTGTVVSADTVVHRGQTIYEKPLDRPHAQAMLRELSGQWHKVTTGVCVLPERGPGTVFSVTTAVRFRELSDQEITAYVATGEADDKAGAYGIQGVAGVFVAQVDGSWTSVMGLPVEETLAAIRQSETS